MSTTPERTTSETIWQFCLTLHNAGSRAISRPVIAKGTGLKMVIVDDHVTRMVEQGRLRRVGAGMVEVVEQFPCNRPISKTVLPDGSVIMEVGDEVSKWTPGEAHVVGAMLHGEATLYAQLRGDRDQTDRVARLERDAQDAKKRLTEQAKEIARLRQQPQLAFE